MGKKVAWDQIDVFLDYLSEIERNKIWPLSGEISYEKHQTDSFENYIATQLFDKKKKKLGLSDIEETIWFINWWKNNLLELKQRITNDSFLEKAQRNFLINNIDSILTRMNLVLKWVYIEAEKWWYKLDREKRNELKQEIQKLSVKIWWDRISDTDEKDLVVKAILEKYNDKNDILSKEECKKMDQFFQKFKLKDEKRANLGKEDKLEWTIDLDKYVHIIKMILEKIYWIQCVFVSKWFDFRTWVEITENSYDEKENIVFIKLDSDDYEINKFLEKNNISEKFRINIDPKKGNLSAWAWAINIPYIQNYKKMNITRFLSLIEHELKHVIRARKSAEALPVNIDKKIDNIDISNKEKWFQELDSTEIEEWITKFSEEAVSKDIEDMQADVWISHIATFIWENYWYTEWKELLKIYLKLDWNDEKTAEEISDIKIRRAKRFFPLDEPGAYGKDTVYYRSKKNVIKLVQQCQKEND